ncbi:DUF2935 domain-containing protein [Fictibacillus gelatini]|uniref:DUF2935 domain-containing protein n=1 Tax=Fictibacillus gelatini TaxID=225985 RepID=UPI00040D2A97|nr:DUF2935 domain-containing protein [Fictibacillus gelatini]
MAYEIIHPWEEHAFWLEILEDHAYFIRDFLSPDEERWVAGAQYYIHAFSQLRKKLQTISLQETESSQKMIEFSNEAYPVAYGYYQFEGHLQRLRIENKVNLNLTPTYLNGTLNENQEYLRLLSFYRNGETPPILSLVELLDLWLEDQVGHAALLIRSIDGVELPLVKETEQFKQQFEAHMVKNEAIKGYLRFTPQNFPAQIHFARNVALSVSGFTRLVEHAVQLFEKEEIFTQTTLRFLEHHFPEACYFLKKLSHYAPDIHYPPCSLSKPSFRKK